MRYIYLLLPLVACAPVFGQTTVLLDGTYIVPNEVVPGLYVTNGESTEEYSYGCSWEVQIKPHPEAEEETEMSVFTDGGKHYLVVPDNARYVKTSGGCRWTLLYEIED